jgi:hypothetical protein
MKWVAYVVHEKTDESCRKDGSVSTLWSYQKFVDCKHISENFTHSNSINLKSLTKN